MGLFVFKLLPCRVSDVLNLLSQVSILLDNGVLAYAYHLAVTNEHSFIGCWLKTGLRYITRTAGYGLLYQYEQTV